MKRLLITALVLAFAGGFALLAGGAAGGGGAPMHHYQVEMDNAFGLVRGADLKVGGVRAGQIKDLKLDTKTNHALVGIDVGAKGFDSFRSDVTCESRPQSLIGEYFLDCQPGNASERLRNGATIPISHTTSTIPGDLVNNILRRPYRERLRIILGELGAGVGGRAQDLNDALRRFNPALRETDKVLAILAKENQTLKNLTQNADTVITALSNNRHEVSRFVVTAGRTSQISATRQAQIAETFRRFPGFLEQLRPAMTALGRVADNQTPALRDLNASAVELRRLFANLGPFAEASRPSFSTLAAAARTGRTAVAAATPTVAQLNTFSQQAPEVSKNLAIVLEHLDNPKFAVESDQRAKDQHKGFSDSPGYTGLEALLQYTFDQTQAANIFDREHYILKNDVFLNDCALYADAQTVKDSPDRAKRCSSNTMGPRQPGINEPDPTATTHGHQRGGGTSTSSAPQAAPAPTGTPKGASPGSSGGGRGGAAPSTGLVPPLDLSKTLEQIPGIVQGVLPKVLPGGKLPNTNDIPGGLSKGVKALGGGGASRGNYRTSGTDSRGQGQMLDYLLAP